MTSQKKKLREHRVWRSLFIVAVLIALATACAQSLVLLPFALVLLLLAIPMIGMFVLRLVVWALTEE